MQALGNLSPFHQDQIKQFLRFFRSQREVALQALNADFDDIKSDRLYEDTFTQSEVEELLNNLFSLTQGTVKTELANTVNMTVLLMKQLFEKADEQGIQLGMDCGIIEDQSMLDSIENMRVDAPAVKRVEAPAGPSKLVSLKDDHAKLLSDAEALGKTNQQLQERFNALQSQTSEILKEKSKLAREVSELRSELRMRDLEVAQAKDSSENKNEIDPELQREIDALKGELSEAKEENTKRLNESKQFSQMRKIINTKSDQIRELRQKLAKYERDADGDIEDADSDEAK